MGVEGNKRALRRIVDEILNTGDLTSFDELVHPAYVDGFDGTGREDYRELVGLMRGAFPDLRVTIEDVIADGDKVVARFLLSGTHRGEFLGIPPTDKRVQFDGIGIIEFLGGKMVSRWNVSDVFGLVEQLRAE